MENRKRAGGLSSSSFINELFGAKEPPPPSSSTGILASIFPPPSTVVGRNYSNFEFRGPVQKQPSGNPVWGTKQGTLDDVANKNSEGASSSVFNKERSSIFQDRVEPCPLSSSLYYGGQEDMYVKSSSAQTTGSYPIFKKNGEEDDLNGNDPHSASRGNWWQGSLYY